MKCNVFEHAVMEFGCLIFDLLLRYSLAVLVWEHVQLTPVHTLVGLAFTYAIHILHCSHVYMAHQALSLKTFLLPWQCLAITGHTISGVVNSPGYYNQRFSSTVMQGGWNWLPSG